MDDLYGRNEALANSWMKHGIEYYGDVPVDTQVYLEQAQSGLSAYQAGQTFEKPQNCRNGL